MTPKLLSFAIALVSLVLVAPAFAGTGGPAPITTITKAGRHDNKVFVGINWNWGVREGVSGVVGYRRARVNTSDKVRGALVDFTFPITGAPFGLGEFHVKGLAGSRSIQGEAGVGYGIQAGAFLVNAGVRGPFVNAGTDYLFGNGWQPYVGIDTLQRPKPHTETTTSVCPDGSAPVAGVCKVPPPPGPAPG